MGAVDFAGPEIDHLTVYCHSIPHRKGNYKPLVQYLTRRNFSLDFKFRYFANDKYADRTLAL